MERNQVVRHYILHDGERVSLLVSSDSLPAYYPTLLATPQLRNASKAAGWRLTAEKRPHLLSAQSGHKRTVMMFGPA